MSVYLAPLNWEGFELTVPYLIATPGFCAAEDNLTEYFLAEFAAKFKIAVGVLDPELKLMASLHCINWEIFPESSQPDLKRVDFDLLYPNNICEEEFQEIWLREDCANIIKLALSRVIRNEYVQKMTIVLARQFSVPEIVVIAANENFEDAPNGRFTISPYRIWVSYDAISSSVGNSIEPGTDLFRSTVAHEIADTIGHELCHALWSNIGYGRHSPSYSRNPEEDKALMGELVNLMNADRDNLMPYVSNNLKFGGSLTLTGKTSKTYYDMIEPPKLRTENEILPYVISFLSTTKIPRPYDKIDVDELNAICNINHCANALECFLFICNEHHPTYKVYKEDEIKAGTNIEQWLDVILYEEILCRFMGLACSRIPLEVLEKLLPNSYPFFKKHLLEDCIDKSFNLVLEYDKSFVAE